jgi:hypothetical protein
MSYELRIMNHRNGFGENQFTIYNSQFIII